MSKKLTLKSYIISTAITIIIFIIGIVFSFAPRFGFSKIWQWIGIMLALIGLVRSFYTRWQYRASEWFKVERENKNTAK